MWSCSYKLLKGSILKLSFLVNTIVFRDLAKFNCLRIALVLAFGKDDFISWKSISLQELCVFSSVWKVTCASQRYYWPEVVDVLYSCLRGWEEDWAWVFLSCSTVSVCEILLRKDGVCLQEISNPALLHSPSMAFVRFWRLFLGARITYMWSKRYL